MFAEDTAVFLRDFGVLVTWYGAPWAVDRTGPTLDSTKFGPSGLQQQTALALFDKPDNDMLGKRALSRGYEITFPDTQFVGIKHADAIVIAGQNFSVLEIKSLDDGAFLVADLQSV